MSVMLKRVESYIEEHRLLQRDGRYLVALSGGADSVALLLVLQELGYAVETAHCNFHLRGEESDRDEQFVVTLCEGRGIALHRAHFDTREYAALHHVSIEMAARELRYRYFEQLRQDLQLDGICVAHHRDDSVETVLMNLVRGTGLRGLQGIRPKNGYILRPLLCVSRQDIEHFLAERQQSFVTDSSNLKADVVRNKIRLNILPQLLDINPAASSNIQLTAEHVADALSVYDDAIQTQRREAVVEESDSRLVLDMSKLTNDTVLFEILREYGFNAAQAAAVRTTTGKLFSAPDYDLVVDRGRLIVERREEQLKPLRIPEPGNYVISDKSQVASNKLEGRYLSRITCHLSIKPSGFVPSKEPNLVHLDADKVQFPLKLRPVREGDWFVPFGMTGHKLVSDFLTDRKVNLLDKRKALVVCDATNAVLWLVGYRTDNRFRISEETKAVLELSLNF